jgi:hypothetical protein
VGATRSRRADPRRVDLTRFILSLIVIARLDRAIQ